MGILSETVIAKWNGNNRKHYEGKGYIYTKLNNTFEVKVDDLTHTSSIYVKVQCDSCLKELKEEQKFANVYVNMNKHEGLYICNECSLIINGKNRRSNTKKFKKQVYDLVGEEYTVLGEYELANNKILMRHNCVDCGNYEWGITPAHFLNGRRCPKCANNIKFTLDDIKAKLKISHPNIKVLSEFYKKVGITDIRDTHYINCKCTIDGNEWSATVASILSGCNCPKCRAKFMTDLLRFDLDYVKEELTKTNKNIIILSDKYEGALSYLNVKCLVCNNEWDATFDGLNNGGHGCPKCAIKNNSGINNCNYNPDLTDEERELRRNYIGNENYDRWRRDVYKRDNYTCQCCGTKSGLGKAVVLNAHHLNGYHWDKENRINIDNGITICKSCHDKFHKIYKNKYNTKEQYEEYKKMIDVKVKEIV